MLSVATLLFVVAGTPGLLAQEQAPPLTAERLLDLHAEAMGPKDAFAAVRTVVARGTLELVGMGVTGAITVILARPDRSLVEVTAEELGTMRSGTGGDVAWELSDLQGPRLLEGSEKAFALRGSLVDAPWRWRDLYRSVELQGTEVVDGVDCDRLLLHPVEGKPETWFLNRSTHLQVKTVMTLQHAMGEVQVETTAADYRRVGGVLFPFRTTQTMLMQEMVTDFETLEVNAEVPEEKLLPPAEIRALLERESTPEPARESPAAAGG
ncbi:MAG: outer membrane lipoprotein-sorting protein [Acidimicrobiales bacterium]|nr:outer membrane lipoprotein-sorting protein [Acidimicrobiales bacterium]